ncbi:hypothetical protein F4803DRAFT_195652 [Xylaria telfairii]|nr:hypothetical protein F4803DRAFT_195652 [Xylaria telfairii]
MELVLGLATSCLDWWLENSTGASWKALQTARVGPGANLYRPLCSLPNGTSAGTQLTAILQSTPPRGGTEIVAFGWLQLHLHRMPCILMHRKSDDQSHMQNLLRAKRDNVRWTLNITMSVALSSCVPTCTAREGSSHMSATWCAFRCLRERLPAHTDDNICLSRNVLLGGGLAIYSSRATLPLVRGV